MADTHIQQQGRLALASAEVRPASNRHASPTVFIPRSQQRASSNGPNKSQHLSTRQLLKEQAELTQVIRTTASHLPPAARHNLQTRLQRLEEELRLRTDVIDKGKARAADPSTPGIEGDQEVNGWILVPKQQQQHPAAAVDQLRGVIAQLEITPSHNGQNGLEPGPHSAANTLPEAALAYDDASQLGGKSMTFRQQLAQGIVNAGSPTLGSAPFMPAKVRRSSAQGPIRLLEPRSAALAEAEALQAADHLRKAEEVELERQRRLQAQSARASTSRQAQSQTAGSSSHGEDVQMDTEGSDAAAPDGCGARWSFYTPDGLFGPDEDDDQDGDEPLRASVTDASIADMSMSGLSTAPSTLSSSQATTAWTTRTYRTSRRTSSIG
ncbi:hypothetical protein V8E36_001590 [Tilletia maclaganii]